MHIYLCPSHASSWRPCNKPPFSVTSLVLSQIPYGRNGLHEFILYFYARRLEKLPGPR